MYPNPARGKMQVTLCRLCYCCKSICNFLSYSFRFFTANVDLTYDHLGRGLMWSYLVRPRISQMCMTSKQHMYRCTTTWSARTRNCIPFSRTSPHICTRTLNLHQKLDASQVNVAHAMYRRGSFMEFVQCGDFWTAEHMGLHQWVTHMQGFYICYTRCNKP